MKEITKTLLKFGGAALTTVIGGILTIKFGKEAFFEKIKVEEVLEEEGDNL